MNKAKPTMLKLLEGNPGKRPINKNEPRPSKGEIKCPGWLLKDAKKEWKRVLPELERLGLLTTIDIAALVGYCQSWARYVEAEKFLKDNDSIFITDKGYMGQVPQVGMAQKYLKLCQSFMTEFGFTPSSRGRLSLPNKDQDKELLELIK